MLELVAGRSIMIYATADTSSQLSSCKIKLAIAMHDAVRHKCCVIIVTARCSLIGNTHRILLVFLLSVVCPYLGPVEAGIQPKLMICL